MTELELEILFDQIATCLLESGKSVDEVEEILSYEVERVCDEIRDIQQDGG